MASWTVYILRCADGSLYTGITNDLASRVERHNSGKGARYTRSRRPVTVVWKRRAKDKSSALKREHALKQLTRAQKLSLLTPSASPSRRPSTAPRASSASR